MNKLSKVEEIIYKNDGIAKTSDFVAEGITPYDVTTLYDEGIIERVHHGYYTLSDFSSISEEKIIKTMIPEAVISMESALFYYGYNDFSPRKWDITVPRTISRTRLKQEFIPLKIYYVKEELYELGKTTGEFGGIILNVYDRERTICDCFKNRSKIDSEVFNKAIIAYTKDKNKNLNNLSKYAQELRVYKKVMGIMEVLING